MLVVVTGDGLADMLTLGEAYPSLESRLEQCRVKERREQLVSVPRFSVGQFVGRRGLLVIALRPSYRVANHHLQARSWICTPIQR